MGTNIRLFPTSFSTVLNVFCSLLQFPEVLQKVRDFTGVVYTENHKCLIINGYPFEGGHYSFLD